MLISPVTRNGEPQTRAMSSRGVPSPIAATSPHTLQRLSRGSGRLDRLLPVKGRREPTGDCGGLGVKDRQGVTPGSPGYPVRGMAVSLGRAAASATMPAFDHVTAALDMRGGFLEWCPVRPFSSNCARLRQSYPSMPACSVRVRTHRPAHHQSHSNKRSQARRSAARHPRACSTSRLLRDRVDSR